MKLQQLLKSSYFNPNSVDLKDRYGRTPLIFSVLGDHNECTEILLKVCYFKIIYKDLCPLQVFISYIFGREKHKTKPQVQHVICSKFFGTVMYKIKLTNYH